MRASRRGIDPWHIKEKTMACFQLMRTSLAIVLMVALTCQQGICAAPELPQDNGWPRRIANSSGAIIYYQPQINRWDNYKALSGQAAFSLTPSSGKGTVGVVSFHASTDVDKENRTVYLHDIQYTSVRFPSLDAQTSTKMEQLFRALAPHEMVPLALDRLLADLDESKTAAAPVALENDPPAVFSSTSPAILLLVQGEPVLTGIPKTNLQFVVNTTWDVFFEKSKRQYYLLANNVWLAASAIKGPWVRASALPEDMSKLPAGGNWDAVRKAIPPQAGTTPQVFFSNTPADLILFKGAPVYSRIAGTHLLYVVNTDNDVFLEDLTRTYYVLLSGRWFSAPSLSGQWAYAGDRLPADFAKISDSSAKAHVLASVPGTIQASDAVMLAQIPTTVIVNRAEAEANVRVAYDGAPEFKPIEQTSLQYAVNTEDKIIKDGDLFYLCFQGVWFMSTSPEGPWKTADSVPREIYTIPPSSPVYNVTYVTQTNPTATTVESSSTAGYLGMFVIGMAAGVAIAYGTGFFYPPYVYWGGVYPIYHPWPMTYGAGVVYNPWTGGWAAGRAAYGPYGAAGSAAWYNPATGRYGHSTSVQGWYGGRTVASAYNPWTGGYGATAQGHNAYAQWGSSVVTRNGQWAQTGHVTTANGTIAGFRTSSGQHGTIYSGANGTIVKGPNGVYAGNDGNAYRKNSDGSWSKYDNGQWNALDTSAAKQNFANSHPNARKDVHNAQDQRATTKPGVNGRLGASQGIQPQTGQSLDHSAQSRQRGQFQTRRFQNSRRGGFRR
jgi:hypothetical protein